MRYNIDFSRPDRGIGPYRVSFREQALPLKQIYYFIKSSSGAKKVIKS